MLYLGGRRLRGLQPRHQLGVAQEAALGRRQAQQEVALQGRQLYLTVVLALRQEQLPPAGRSRRNGG